MQVVLADIEEEALEKTVDNLRQYQHRVIGIKTDVLMKSQLMSYFKAKESMEIFIFFATMLASELIQETKLYGR